MLTCFMCLPWSHTRITCRESKHIQTIGYLWKIGGATIKFGISILINKKSITRIKETTDITVKPTGESTSSDYENEFTDDGRTVCLMVDDADNIPPLSGPQSQFDTIDGENV